MDRVQGRKGEGREQMDLCGLEGESRWFCDRSSPKKETGMMSCSGKVKKCKGTYSLWRKECEGQEESVNVFDG